MSLSLVAKIEDDVPNPKVEIICKFHGNDIIWQTSVPHLDDEGWKRRTVSQAMAAFTRCTNFIRNVIFSSNLPHCVLATRISARKATLISCEKKGKNDV